MEQAASPGGKQLVLRWVAAVLAVLTVSTGFAGGATTRGPDVTVLVSEAGSAGHAAETAVAHLGGRVIRQLSVIDGFAARLPQAAVPVLSSVPGVRWVSPNRSLQLEGQYGQDSGVASAVYTDVTRASKAWSQGVTGAGMTVALIDTGVNTSGDLAGQVVHAEDFTPEQNNLDSYGHGTFVAGLIDGTGAASGGAIKGIAPGAKIVSLKIAGADGTTDVLEVLAALEWIVDYKDVYGIRIVNLSLGFNASQPYLVDPLDFAVERVWNDGVVVVAAAGNGNNVPGSITSPGNDPRVITVGSSNDKTTVALSDDKLATFSSVGPTTDGFTKPEILAPGRSVVSSRSPGSTIDTTYPDSEVADVYAKGSGTSFSSAIASGVAALVLQRTPLLSPDQVKRRMVTTTRAIGGITAPAWWPGEVDAFGATMSLDLLPANIGVAPANGGGSLQALRGAFCLRYTDGTCMTDDDANAAVGFDPTQYDSNTWAGSLWLGSQWVASLGSQWAGSQWAGSQWAGSQWAGSQWAGSQWSGSQWTGSQWASAPWASSMWGYIP
jgi:serine protease AprX